MSRVFCQLHVHCIHLARGMMRMRIPSRYSRVYGRTSARETNKVGARPDSDSMQALY